MGEASLKIHFIILGATAAGLACAITLRRAGHQVTLLEVEDEVANEWGISGCSIPPNMSKLLIRWGLEAQVRQLSVASRTILMAKYDGDEVLGMHTWDEELFKDAGGDFLFMHYADVRRLLHSTALSLGAKIIPEARISLIDFEKDERPFVRLTSGEILGADVIVGTDGPHSIARRMVLEQDADEIKLGMSIFNVSVPREAMEKDPELSYFLKEKRTTYMWMGNSRGAVGFTAGIHPSYAVNVYAPDHGTEQYWGKDVPAEKVIEAMGDCEPRLRKLVALAGSARCVPLTEPPELETWVHDSGRLLILGDAAHPFPRGSTNGVSTSVCDAAALGELFRHLNSESQIESFLYAFEGIRRERVRAMLDADLGNYAAIAMPPGEAHEARDRMMKEKHQAGVGALSGADDAEDVLAAHWEKDKEVFAYDAEDHAAEWWNDWGLLKERAANQVRIIEEKVPVIEVEQIIAPGIEVN